VYLSSTNDVSNDLQIAEVGSATSSEPVGMANLTESLDTLARVASQDTTHASLLNLISRGAFSVCSLMGIHFTQVTPIGCGFALFSLRHWLNPL
jgi:hypothetical protein